MTPEQAERLIVAVERIAAALDQPAPAPAAAAAPKGCADGVHPDKARVEFGGDEWECAVHKGGCGYRSPALVGVER